jgi:hypothetical protein
MSELRLRSVRLRKSKDPRRNGEKLPPRNSALPSGRCLPPVVMMLAFRLRRDRLRKFKGPRPSNAGKFPLQHSVPPHPPNGLCHRPVAMTFARHTPTIRLLRYKRPQPGRLRQSGKRQQHRQVLTVVAAMDETVETAINRKQTL